MAEVSKEVAAERAARNLFYLREMLDLDQYEFVVARMRGSLRRSDQIRLAEDGRREDAWGMVRREVLDALEHKEPASNLPARGRLFAHFYIGVRYVCATAKLSWKAHEAVQALLRDAIEDLEVEYKGHKVRVASLVRWS